MYISLKSQFAEAERSAPVGEADVDISECENYIWDPRGLEVRVQGLGFRYRVVCVNRGIPIYNNPLSGVLADF